MGLYQRPPSKVWYWDAYVNGKRVQRSTGTTNRRKAEKINALRVSEIERGQFAPLARRTLSELESDYMEFAKANKRSWVRDQQLLTHLRRRFGQTQLSGIGPLAIERYKNERLKEEARPATVNRELALLKRLFNVADQWGLFSGRNPMKGVRFLDEDNLKLRTLSEAEESALLKNCYPYLQDLVLFALGTGLRLGDILNLKWEEVDLQAGVLRLLARKTRRMLEVPLSETAMKIVRGQLGIRKCDFVFYNPQNGERWKDLRVGLSIACRKVGIEGVTWHTLRHTFATRLVQAGVDLVTVKELLGHSSITVTMRYAHTNLDAKQRAVNLIRRVHAVSSSEQPAREQFQQ